ncbi:MAG: CarD family transcriptional regulator [Wujia sp.]
MMYKKGEYVIYGSKGVCQVGDVTTLNLNNVPKDREYYVLFPKNNGGTIYVPVDVASTKMRKIITKEEAFHLIESIPEIEPIEISNEKKLEERYKICIRSNECIEWIRLIKCIYGRKQLRLSEGKKMTAIDEKYMHMAEDALYLELGTALNLQKEQVLEYIIKEIEESA